MTTKPLTDAEISQAITANSWTTGKISRLCGVSARSAAKWIDSGILQGFRIPGGQDRRVTTEVLLRFLETHGMQEARRRVQAPCRTVAVCGLPAMLQGDFRAYLPKPWTMAVAPSLFALLGARYTCVIAGPEVPVMHAREFARVYGENFPGARLIAVIPDDGEAERWEGFEVAMRWRGAEALVIEVLR